MNLAYCVIALALTGADDPGLARTLTRNAPLWITIDDELGKPAGPSTPVPSVARDSAVVVAGSLTCAAAMSAAALPAPFEIGQSAGDAPPAPFAKRNEVLPQEIWPLTLRNAIGIALDNSETIRLLVFGKSCIPVGNCFGPALDEKDRSDAARPRPSTANPSSIVIEPLTADASVYRFKSEVMTLVRAVEQQYWSLAQAHAALWAADRAVTLARQVVKTEQNELTLSCHGGIGDLAEASDHLERLEHNLVEQTCDVIAAERAFRDILGLPQSDNRRIIPVTPPTQARLEPDWDACLDTLMHQQPDVIQQKALARLAELQLLITRHAGLTEVNLKSLDQLNALGQMLDGPEEALMSTFHDGLELGSPKKLQRFKASLARSSAGDRDVLELLASEAANPRRPVRRGFVNTRAAQYKLLRSRAFLRQVVHQTTHSLARGFREVDAGYKSYAIAKRQRNTTERRLEAQRAYWEEGGITSDRFLDAVDDYAAAVTAENQCLATYDSAIAFLSECKGTLLEDHDIIVVESHRRNQSRSERHLAGSDD